MTTRQAPFPLTVIPARRCTATRLSIGLERRAADAYSPPMDDTSHRRPPADWDPPMPSEADLLAALAESDAEAEAGLFVDGDEIIRELYAEAERLEAEQAEEQNRTAALRR